MNKIFTLGIGLILILLISCKTEPKKLVEIENPTEFKEGEWISNKDSLNGISIRKGMLAFFENMKFPGDSIYDYKVVDSISIIGDKKNKIGTYIKRMNFTDTLYVEIIDFTDSTLTLKKQNETEIYKLE
jgi:hypothetical protein